ncbi:protein of unknown function (plasmid) [Azospirillum baldaniorum]|uniref:Uncharacterized protein n=1 Tax=Azospirillum baldaniorum TaxID=1064539 RepID=A0A9P1JTR0_9PROT|nr:protein of unknown function [Azospirillum baldaniorum]
MIDKCVVRYFCVKRLSNKQFFEANDGAF